MRELRIVLSIVIGLAVSSQALTQEIGPKRGVLVLSGAGEPHGDSALLRRFVDLAGGADAEIVYIPTAASGIRLPSGFIAELPDSGEVTPDVRALESELAALFRVRRVRVLHTRDPSAAASELMARGHMTGFGFLRNVAINPHLTSANRQGELIDVVDQHPELLGIGLEDAAGLLVVGDTAEVIGSGRAAIYDDARHERLWYYWLQPGERFDLKSRRRLNREGFDDR